MEKSTSVLLFHRSLEHLPEKVDMSKQKNRIRPATNHLTWTLNYLYSRASKDTTIDIIDKFYDFAILIDRNFKSDWTIDYHALVEKAIGHPMFDSQLVYYPWLLQANNVAVIKFDDYIIKLDLEFSLHYNEMGMMTTNADKVLSEDRIGMNTAFDRIGRLIDIKLRGLGIKTFMPSAGERSSPIYYQTKFIDDKKTPKGLVHLPLGIAATVYKREYLESEAHSNFIPEGIVISYSDKHAKSFINEIVYPNDIQNDKQLNAAMLEELIANNA